MVNQIKEEEEMWRAKADELFNLEGWGDDSSVDDEASDTDDEYLSIPSLETDDPFLRIESDVEGEEEKQEGSVATDDSDSTGPPLLIPRPATSVSSSDSDSEDSSDDEVPSLITKRVEDSRTEGSSIPYLVLGKRTMPTKVPEWIMANRKEEEIEEKRAVITIMVGANFDFEPENEFKGTERKLKLKLESDTNSTKSTEIIQDSEPTDDRNSSERVLS